MPSCQNRERVPEADVLRAICCVIVVLLHAFIGAEIHPGLDRSYELGGLIAYQLLLWATPLFAVLSGFVLFHRNREVASPVEFWQRRSGAVLVPFLFWTAVYWLVQPAYGHPLRIATGLVLGQSGQRHLYFVAMILQFYALFPLLCRWGRAGRWPNGISSRRARRRDISRGGGATRC